MNEIEIREIKDIEMNDCLDLVWKTFLEFEAPDYTQEGIEEFKKAIFDNEWLKQSNHSFLERYCFFYAKFSMQKK